MKRHDSFVHAENKFAKKARGRILFFLRNYKRVKSCFGLNAEFRVMKKRSKKRKIVSVKKRYSHAKKSLLRKKRSLRLLFKKEKVSFRVKKKLKAANKQKIFVRQLRKIKV